MRPPRRDSIARTGTLGRKRLPVYLIALLLAVVAGCDVFSPRTPEPPTGGGGTFDLPAEPGIVVSNIRAAVTALNTENYVNSMAEDFTFVPARSAESAFAWSSWDINDERTYLNRISVQPGTSVQLVLADDNMEFDGTSRAVYSADYTLTVPHRQPGQVAQTLGGRLVWSLRQDADNLWRLHQWTDQQSGDTPSWSSLKAAFAQ